MLTWAATPPETPRDSTAHMFMKAVNSYMVCRQHLATMAISTCTTLLPIADLRRLGGARIWFWEEASVYEIS